MLSSYQAHLFLADHSSLVSRLLVGIKWIADVISHPSTFSLREGSASTPLDKFAHVKEWYDTSGPSRTRCCKWNINSMYTDQPCVEITLSGLAMPRQALSSGVILSIIVPSTRFRSFVRETSGKLPDSTVVQSLRSLMELKGWHGSAIESLWLTAWTLTITSAFHKWTVHVSGVRDWAVKEPRNLTIDILSLQRTRLHVETRVECVRE